MHPGTALDLPVDRPPAVWLPHEARTKIASWARQGGRKRLSADANLGLRSGDRPEVGMERPSLPTRRNDAWAETSGATRA
jgi:hypothetical protein